MPNEKGAKILEQIEAAGRRVLPMHEYLAEADPDTFEAFNGFLTHSIYREGGLDEAHKEMVLACACVSVGSSQAVIANHCRKALAAGLSRDILLQALEITAAVMVTRTLASGVNALMDADES